MLSFRFFLVLTIEMRGEYRKEEENSIAAGFQSCTLVSNEKINCNDLGY